MSGDGRWSADVGAADWIGLRLTPWPVMPFGDDSALRVTTVVPSGFERYARLLHPASAGISKAGEVSGSSGSGGAGGVDGLSGARGGRVRWAAVAAWSGLPLPRSGGFHTVALPPGARPGPPPFEDGPAVGTLALDEAAALASVLRGWTATPDDCWFCVWEGFGWESGVPLVSFRASAGPARDAEETEAAARLLGDPVPPSVRDGSRVRLPHRDYLLYRGPAEAVDALAVKEQTPNLWWPADRAWCVGTEIDLQSTYVGGPAGLIDALLSDPRVEAVPVLPDDPVSLVLAPWVAAWIEELTDTLIADGEATLVTARGTVRAWLRPPGGGAPSIRVEVDGDLGRRSSSEGRIRAGDPAELRRSIVSSLTYAIIGLAPEE